MFEVTGLWWVVSGPIFYNPKYWQLYAAQEKLFIIWPTKNESVKT